MDDIEKDVATIQQIEAIPAILKAVAKATDMGYVTVARVTETRWIACQVLDLIDFGLAAGSELPIKTTFCSKVRASGEDVVIDDVADDPTYVNHQTPAMYGFKSYISVPIVLQSGEFFGTLCAIDPKPHRPSESVDMMRLFAELISFHLDAIQRIQETEDDLQLANAELDNSRIDLAASQASLLDAQSGAELREQFIAVLGHDLRNPLAAIEGGRRILEKAHDDPKSVRVLRLMSESVNRMSGLINDVMDFARGRMGSGISLTPEKTRLEPVLAQVVNEIKTAYPERQIQIQFDLDEPVQVDKARMAQMFSNLLANAVTHGDAEKPILVEAALADGQLRLAVANGGEPILPAAMDRLFQPFYRGEVRPSMQGLGLGLYIANQIAVAHGGSLSVVSDSTETRFTFQLATQH